MRALLSAIAVMATAGAVLAQPVPGGPRGPADIIGGAQKARSERELRQAVDKAPASADPGAPAAAANAAATEQAPAEQTVARDDPHAGNPHTANPHGGLAGQPEQKPMTTAGENPTLATGTVRALVLDRSDAAVAGTTVVLGVMKSDGSRSEERAQTDRSGYATFEKLEVGERQAYRVNVMHGGARYSSNPFRLPLRGGYDVMVRQLPVTRDPASVVLYVGATSIELKDDRLKVVQQARFYNIGAETYVFPEKGELVRLPEGFTAVQSQESMTDQRVVEAPEGLRVFGSLQPGETTMLWGFDLPQTTSEASFAIPVPWTTFAYRVVADAPPGLAIAVDGFPAPEAHEDAGRRFFVTEIQRRVGDPPFKQLRIELTGIPGPGPGRWVAALLALCAIVAGAVIALRAPAASERDPRATLEARKVALIRRARELETQRGADEIGPEYHREQLAALTDELAAVLLAESRLEPAGR